MPRLNRQQHQSIHEGVAAMQRKCGYPVKKWNDAKRQVREVLINRAKAGDIISYARAYCNM